MVALAAAACASEARHVPSGQLGEASLADVVDTGVETTTDEVR